MVRHTGGKIFKFAGSKKPLLIPFQKVTETGMAG
jgi:hypothetical protein